MTSMNVRRLAAIDMYGTRGTSRRMRFILAEFTAGFAVMIAIGFWLAAGAASTGGRILGIWLMTAGLNYAPLAVYAVTLRRPGALQAELAGVDTGRELRRYSILQLWILVPLSLLFFTLRGTTRSHPGQRVGSSARRQPPMVKFTPQTARSLPPQRLPHDENEVHAPRVMMTPAAAWPALGFTHLFTWSEIRRHDMREFVKAGMFAPAEIGPVVRADLHPVKDGVSVAAPLPANHRYGICVSPERGTKPLRLLHGMEIGRATPAVNHSIVSYQRCAR